MFARSLLPARRTSGWYHRTASVVRVRPTPLRSCRSLSTSELSALPESIAAPLTWTLTKALSELSAGRITSQKLTELSLDHIARWSQLRMFITTGDRAKLMAQAADSDARRRSGSPNVRALDGIPIAVKDNFCTAGMRTTAASKMLNQFTPPYDSAVSERLVSRGGAIIIGKTNLDEFGMGNATANSHFGRTISPWSERHHVQADSLDCLSAGGSSGGSAAAVAAFCCYGAIGSDTGGSIRLPAAYCGVVGIKPTYGRVSRWGLIEYASSLDTAGVIARSVDDARLVLSVIEGVDAKDSTSLPSVPLRSSVDVDDSARPLSLSGKRVGIPDEYFVADLDPEIVRFWQTGAQQLRDAGAEVVSVSLASTRAALPAYYILAPAEATSNLARYDGVRYGHSAHPTTITAATATAASASTSGVTTSSLYTSTRSDGFGGEVKRRIMIGNFVLSSKSYQTYVRRSQLLRRLVTDDFRTLFQNGIDFLLTPTAATPALSFAQISKLTSVAHYMHDLMTIPANLAGLPAMSVPVGLSKSNLPVGLQLIGRVMDDDSLLSAGRVLERASNATIGVEPGSYPTAFYIDGGEYPTTEPYPWPPKTNK